MIRGKPSPHTLWKRLWRSKQRRESDPAAFYAARHKRKHEVAPPRRRGGEFFSSEADWDTYLYREELLPPSWEEASSEAHGRRPQG